MTAQEAKALFERDLRYSKGDEDCPEWLEIFNSRKLAISALEKQIPKKPTPYKGYEGQCVGCGAVFLDRSTKYCGNCGQALDWSDAE